MNRILSNRVITTTVVALLLTVATAIAHDPRFHEAQPEHRRWSKQEQTSFLQRMRSRHALTAQVGKLARQRATQPKLRAWGDSLYRTHATEDKRIQAMLRTGYQVTPAPASVATSSLAKLKGAAFDQEVLSVLVRELGEGVTEAKECERMGMSADLLGACATWSALQQKEVVTAGGWLCEWFQKCE